MQRVYHSHSCATLIEIHIDILLKLFMEASCCCSKQEAVICWYVGILVYPFLQRFCLIFVSPTPLSLVHFCCLCMISVLHSPLYPPPASPQPSISRSLYRNRSFLRIPLAARPRFSSLRSLRFVLPHSAKVKGMPSPPPTLPPPKFTSSTCFSAVPQRSRVVLCILHALYGMQRRICDVFLHKSTV